MLYNTEAETTAAFLQKTFSNSLSSKKSHYLDQLEQLERLRSEIPSAAPWLPILVIHIRSQVKTTQSQSYKF